MENVVIALLLVMGAGSATALGAMVVFFPFLVRHAKTRTLASALGLSAGVMMYVSFIEIFQKSHGSFIAAGHDDNRAHVYATACFFGGVVLMVTLNYGVTALLGGHHHHHQHNHGSSTPTFPAPDTKQQRHKTQSEHSRVSSNNSQQQQPQQQQQEPEEDGTTSNSLMVTVRPMCCSDNPVGELEVMQRMAEEVGTGSVIEKSNVSSDDEDEECQQHQTTHSKENIHSKDDDDNNNTDPHTTTNATAAATSHDEEKLMRMSINTALAIALHNFPEGLATFVATLNDPRVGAVLAIAIAIHNIPEGLCVAMPIYYATGNRWRAFRWGVLSGLSEPVAALLGWAVLANAFSDTLYAVMFGIVAGMMVIISTRELLPTAHRYDPDDNVVTYSFIAGMLIMALSLVLFKI